jgi:hypothetical protein
MKKNIALVVVVVILFGAAFVKAQVVNDSSNAQKNPSITQQQDGGGGSEAPELKIEIPAAKDIITPNDDSTQQGDSSENQRMLNAPVNEKNFNILTNDGTLKTSQKSYIALWIISIFSLLLNIIVITLLLKLSKNKQ